MQKKRKSYLPVFLICYGGLGNQLFMLALAHEFSKRNYLVIVLYTPWNDRGCDSARLSEYCSHNIRYWNRPITLKTQSLKVSNRIINYVQGFCIQLLSFFAIDVASSFVEKGSYELGYVLKGCLQRSEIVTLNPEFTLEVMRLIDDENLSFLPNSNVLCHVRRGDYTSTDYYGLLADEYYRNSLLTIENASATVISDDQNAGKRVAKVIDGEFLETSSVSPFALLGLMHRHKVVVSANSSLSWWGGFLCRFDGGRHLIPTPWLKNTTDEDRWLHYIGCEDVTSIFEK